MKRKELIRTTRYLINIANLLINYLKYVLSFFIIHSEACVKLRKNPLIDVRMLYNLSEILLNMLRMKQK